MEFSIRSGSPEKQRSACVVVGVFEPRKLSVPAEVIDNAGRGYLGDLVRRGDMEGKLGSTLLLHNVPGTLADRVLLVGLGKEKEFREKEFRTAVATAVKTLNETGGFDGTLYLTELLVKKRDVAWRVRQATMVALEALYRFDKLKSKKDDVRRPLRKLTFCVERRNELTMAEDALAQGQAIAAGTLNQRIDGQASTDSLLGAMARMQEQLRGMVSLIQHNASQLNHSAHGINQQMVDMTEMDELNPRASLTPLPVCQ